MYLTYSYLTGCSNFEKIECVIEVSSCGFRVPFCYKSIRLFRSNDDGVSRKLMRFLSHLEILVYTSCDLKWIN